MERHQKASPKLISIKLPRWECADGVHASTLRASVTFCELGHVVEGLSEVGAIDLVLLNDLHIVLTASRAIPMW